MPAIKFRASGCSLNRGSGFTVRFGVKAKSYEKQLYVGA